MEACNSDVVLANIKHFGLNFLATHGLLVGLQVVSTNEKEHVVELHAPSMPRFSASKGAQIGSECCMPIFDLTRYVSCVLYDKHEKLHQHAG